MSYQVASKLAEILPAGILSTKDALVDGNAYVRALRAAESPIIPNLFVKYQ